MVNKTNKLCIIHKMLIEYVIHSGLATCRQSTLRKFQPNLVLLLFCFFSSSIELTIGIYCRQSLHIFNTCVHKYEQTAQSMLFLSYSCVVFDFCGHFLSIQFGKYTVPNKGFRFEKYTIKILYFNIFFSPRKWNFNAANNI